MTVPAPLQPAPAAETSPRRMGGLEARTWPPPDGLGGGRVGGVVGSVVLRREVGGGGVRVVPTADRSSGALGLEESVPEGDVLVTTDHSVVLAILAADCVPVVLYDPAGMLACVHAGW